MFRVFASFVFTLLRWRPAALRYDYPAAVCAPAGLVLCLMTWVNGGAPLGISAGFYCRGGVGPPSRKPAMLKIDLHGSR